MGYFKLLLYITIITIVSSINCINIHAMKHNQSSKIIINLPSYTLTYYENNDLFQRYPIAIGKISTPTPCGSYKIQDKELNPSWYPPDKKGYVVVSGPDNPLGYRWIGFYYNYGIHGTNAPWSIGSAISNGCIRMYEEDVEELFEKVKDDTLISIIYDQVNVEIDPIGQVTIEIYPDIYGYNNLALRDVKYKLAEKYIGNLITDDFLTKIIVAEKKDKIVIGRVSNVRINNKKLAEYLVWWDGLLYAPVELIGYYLDDSIKWDEKKQLVSSKYDTVPGLMKNNRLYVEVNDLPVLFNVEQKWDQDANCLLIEAPTLLLNGQFITHNIQVIDGIPYVPVVKVAQSLQKKIHWDEASQTVWLNSRKISVKEIEGQLYIEAVKMSDYFNISTVYDESLKVINMTGFCCAMDYSMYLGEMGDFID